MIGKKYMMCKFVSYIMLFSSRELMYLLPVQFTYDFKIFAFKKKREKSENEKKMLHMKLVLFQ